MTVEAIPGRQHVVGERLHARGVAQVEAEHLEAVAPVGEVRFGGVAGGGVTGKARGDDQRAPQRSSLIPAW